MENQAPVGFGKPRSLGNVIPSPGFSRLFGFGWPDSLWFNAAFAAIAGFLYSLYLLGPAALNPRNLEWLHGDAATYYVGWALFRQDSHLHWPLTFTNRVGYPIGESISMMDVNPLMALLLRPLSLFLPEPFQYLGIETVLACALQVFFALRLFRLISGSNAWAVVLPSLFFLISPPMTLRAVGHYALTNHWLLTAALLLFCLAQRPAAISNNRLVAMILILASLSVSINPYLAFQVLLLLGTTLISLLWNRRLRFFKTIGALVALGATAVASAFFFGFIVSGGQQYGNGGYRYYSMNLLAPFDPNLYGSLLLRPLPHFTDGQYEGYCYFGAGVLGLALVVGLLSLRGRFNLSWPKWRGPAVLLVLCCSILTLMALSTEITIGSKVLVDWDPRQKFSHLLATLRSSGRLFWTPYYILLMLVLAAPFRLLSKHWANLMVAAALVIQVVDLIPLQQWIHASVNRPYKAALKSPVWARLGSTYQDLVVLPAYQCDQSASPGKADGFDIFGMLAAEQRMRTNSYNSGRYTTAGQTFHCVESIATLTERPLSASAAYVVTPALAIRITSAGLGKCHNLDGFVLCSATDDFGFAPSKWESQTEFWVHNHFRAILLRDPTDAELRKWTQELDQGKQSSADFIANLLGSPEFENSCLPKFWGFLDARKHWPTLSEWLENSPPPPAAKSGSAHESKQLPHDKNRALTYMLYFSVLERNPDPAGLSGWSAGLAQTSVRTVASQFLNSPEYRAHKYIEYR